MAWVIRKIWDFLWYQNLKSLEKKAKDRTGQQTIKAVQFTSVCIIFINSRNDHGYTIEYCKEFCFKNIPCWQSSDVFNFHDVIELLAKLIDITAHYISYLLGEMFTFLLLIWKSMKLMLWFGIELQIVAHINNFLRCIIFVFFNDQFQHKIIENCTINVLSSCSASCRKFMIAKSTCFLLNQLLEKFTCAKIETSAGLCNHMCNKPWLHVYAIKCITYPKTGNFHTSKFLRFSNFGPVRLFVNH